MEQDILRQLKADQEEMQRGVFAHPPQDFAEFCKRLGAWQSNQGIQEHILGLIRANHERDL